MWNRYYSVYSLSLVYQSMFYTENMTQMPACHNYVSHWNGEIFWCFIDFSCFEIVTFKNWICVKHIMWYGTSRYCLEYFWLPIHHIIRYILQYLIPYHIGTDHFIWAFYTAKKLQCKLINNLGITHDITSVGRQH